MSGLRPFANFVTSLKVRSFDRGLRPFVGACLLWSAGIVGAQEVLLFDTSSATSTEDKLMTINQLGGTPTVLLNSSSFTSTPGKMAVDRASRRIYFCDQLTGGGGVFRCNADGSSKTTIFSNSTSGSQVLGIAVDSTHGVLYIVTSNATASEDKLIKCGLDGSTPTVLVSGASFTAFPGAISVDEVNQKIYACDIQSGGGGVFRFNSDGSNKTTIYANSTSGSQIFSVAVDSSRGIVYIISSNASSAEDKLIKTGLSGVSPTVLVSSSSLTTFPNQVAVDMSANRIYVTDSQTAGGGVFRFDSAGGSRTQVYTNSTSGASMISIALNSAASTTISSLNRVDATPSAASTVHWTATFASAVFNVTAANFSLTGTATSGAVVGTPATSNAGFSWNIPVSVVSSGSLQLNLANFTSMSASISSLPFAGQAYTMSLDSTGPTVTIGSPSASVTGGASVSYTVTYADPAFNVSTLAAGDITVNSTGSANISSVGVTGSGTTRTVTLSGIFGNGTLGISIAAGTASDTFGNLALGAGPSTTFTVDNTAPTISIGSPSASTTTGGPVSYTVTYADANFSASTLSAGNITVNSTGSASISSVAVTGSGTTRTVTLSGITGNGTLGISIDAGTALDSAGNSAPAAGPSTAFTVDNTAPTISIGAPSVSATTSGPVSYTVTYADANFSSSTLSAGNITVNSTGSASISSVAVTGSGTTRTVTLSGITGNGALGISIAAGTASDSAGNSAPAAGPSATFFVGNTAPELDLNGAGAGNDVAITFTEQTAELIAPAATLTDAEGSPVVSLEVTLLARSDGDATESLSLDPTATAAASGLTVTPYDAATGILLISGSASTATYETILRGILYNNSSDNPNTTVRSVTVVASDADPSTTRTSTITINTVNDNPVAGSDVVLRAGTANTKVKIATLLANDSDVEGDTISFTGVVSPSAGGATVTTSGSWVYYTQNGTAADSFTYTISDGHGGTAAGTVQVNIQNPNAQVSTVISIVVDGTGAHLTFNGIPGITYTIESKDNIGDAWVAQGTASLSVSGVFHYDDSAGSAGRFYRYAFL